MTQEKLLDKLQKIKRHAESAAAIGSEAEAKTFTEMLNRLLMEHKLEMTDLEFEVMEKEQPVEKHYIDYGQYPDIKIRGSRVAWIETLASIVARAHFCRILVHPGSSRITLVGRKEDTAVAEYMFITLMRATESLANKANAAYRWEIYKRDRNCVAARGFRESFIQSFIMRIEQRLRELRHEHDSNTTALVRINKSDKAVESWFKENATRKASGLTRSVGANREGHLRGRKAADDINLKGKAVEGTASAKRQLT